MNIFAVGGNEDTGEVDWCLSAREQDNKRVVKMILESMQLACTALNVHGVQTPYKSFNPKHPSCLWVTESSSNFEKLMMHARALMNEYTIRYGKVHKSEKVWWNVMRLYDYTIFSNHQPTPLRLAMPDEFKENNVVRAYRRYYASKPNILYPEDKIPTWFLKYRGDLPFKVKNKDGMIKFHKEEKNDSN